jgi:hypothetical protein
MSDMNRWNASVAIYAVGLGLLFALHFIHIGGLPVAVTKAQFTKVS